MNGTVILPASTPRPSSRDDRPAQRRPPVQGILVQLPLPKQIDEHAILERVDPLKDVDGFHPSISGCSRRAPPGSSPARRWGSAAC